MNYFDYRFFHIASILIFTFILAICFMKTSSAFYKILSGLFSLAVIISGFMLFSQASLSLSPPYPTWIWAKLVIWLLMAALVPMIIKRAPKIAPKLSFMFLFTMLVAAYLGIYKTL